MKLIVYPVFFSLILLFIATAHAGRDVSNIELNVIPVSGNIYMLEGINGFAGGNIGVTVGKDGILIVDDQFAEMAPKIKDALNKISQGKLRFILNTHWHGDHTGGNAIFSQDATVISHENVRQRLMTDQKNAFGDSPARPGEAWPIITFDDSLTIYFNDETIKLMHFPSGHTDGDSVIYFMQSNVIHMGDLFFAGMFPFVDIQSGGNVLDYAENVGNILDMIPKDTVIIPGHGTLSARDDLIQFHKMLQDSISFIQNNINAGLNLDKILQQGLPHHLKAWEKGFIKEDMWIKLVYESIMNK